MLLADDMVYLMGRVRILLVQEAIVAEVTGSCCHRAPDGFRDCHRIGWQRARAFARIMRCSSCRKSSSSELSSALSFSALARSRR